MRLAMLTSILLSSALAHAEAKVTIRSLGALDAAISETAPRADAFEVEGIVTSSPSELTDKFILTDGSIHLYITDGVFWPRLALHDGDRVRACGRIVRQKNDTYNYAKAFQIDVLSHGPPPLPVDAKAAEINNGEMRNWLVRLKGTIIDVLRDEIDPRFLFFVISSDGEIVYASMHSTNGTAGASALIGAKASVVGNCIRTHETDTSRFNLGWSVAIRGQGNISVLEPAPKDPFSAPPLEGGVRDILMATASDSPRRKTRGRVIAVWHGDSVLLRTDARHVSRIRISNGATPSVGDVIEAVGMPETDIYTRNLSHAIWRKVGDSPSAAGHHDLTPPQETPESISVKSLLKDDCGRTEMKPRYHGRLVRICGTVQSITKVDDRYVRLTVNDNGTDIPVELGLAETSEAAYLVRCRVEITGVCVMQTETWRPQAPFPRILGFFVVPRSPSDIRILARPPWWTPGRLTAVIGTLLALLLAVLVWNALLRKLSDKKGRELAAARFAQSVSELKVSERTRLATELHDSIVQNLTGASMKMRAADKLLVSRPDDSRRQLGLAMKTLDSCRDELRNCIWDLRSRALDEPTMDKVLHRVLDPYVGAANLSVRFAVPRERLTENAVHAIICIIRELVINAIRHGHATTVHVAGCTEDEAILFSVKDDGCGFDVQSCPGTEQGHFGLQGVRERAASLGGSITVESSPGDGTRIACMISKSGKPRHSIL